MKGYIETIINGLKAWVENGLTRLSNHIASVKKQNEQDIAGLSKKVEQNAKDISERATIADPVFTGKFVQNPYDGYRGGAYSHAEGVRTRAGGESSHAEGCKTDAAGNYSHAEGYDTRAYWNSAHAEGEGTYTVCPAQHVQGRFNFTPNDETIGDDKYAHIVGNGTSDTARSNAHTLDWNGVPWFQGRPQFGGNAQDDESQQVMANGDTEITLKSADGTAHKVTATDDGGLAVDGIPQGEKGEDGKTPVKGTDYWTASDKQEIVDEVLGEIPSGSSGSDLSLGMTGATAGQIAKIAAVDETGKPTAWSPANLVSGEVSDLTEFTYIHLLSETTTEEQEVIAIDLSDEILEKLEQAEQWLLEVYMPLSGTTNEQESVGNVRAGIYRNYELVQFCKDIPAIPTTSVSFMTASIISARLVKGIHERSFAEQIVCTNREYMVDTDTIVKGTLLEPLKTGDRLRILDTTYSYLMPAGTKVDLYAIGRRKVVEMDDVEIETGGFKTTTYYSNPVDTVVYVDSGAIDTVVTSTVAEAAVKSGLVFIQAVPSGDVEMVVGYTKDSNGAVWLVTKDNKWQTVNK